MMTDKLQTVKEALEDILHDYKYNIKEYQLAQSKNGPLGFLLNITGKTRAKQALAELNSYMQARDSEEMVEKVELAIIKLIDEEYTRCECANYKELAKAAIKAMEGGE